MGTPIKLPPAPFVCPLCWGNSGAEFGPGSPPKFITVLTEGVVKSPAWVSSFGEPENGARSVEMRGECNWGFLGSPNNTFWRLIPGNRINVVNSSFSRVFVALSLDVCKRFYSVNETNPAFGFMGGTCEILF